MNYELPGSLAPAERPEQTDTGFVRVGIPDLFPHFLATGEKVQLDIPSDLDPIEAMAEWEQTGGQIRSFGNGANGQVEQGTYSLPQWLVEKKGAIPADLSSKAGDE